MRSVSVACVLAVCSSLVACSVASSDEPAPAAPAVAAQVEGTAPGSAAEAASADVGGDAAPPPAPSTEPDVDGDAGADAGADAGSKHQIPVPTFGKLHAATGSGEPCAFTVDGIARGTSSSLDLTLLTGDHALTCTRASDGYVAGRTFTITASQTTNVGIVLPTLTGKLSVVAVGGTCEFSIDGVAVGVGDTMMFVLPAPKDYEIGCKTPSVTKLRTVSLVGGDTAMAMFKLQ